MFVSYVLAFLLNFTMSQHGALPAWGAALHRLDGSGAVANHCTMHTAPVHTFDTSGGAPGK